MWIVDTVLCFKCAKTLTSKGLIKDALHYIIYMHRRLGMFWPAKIYDNMYQY